MGTKVHCESLVLVGYNHHSMRDLNNESNGCRLPLFYGDSANDQSRNVVRRTMLEHESLFRTQVLELHRVYRLQKDMMDELKKKECGQSEASFSSNDDSRRWKVPTFPSVYDRQSMSVVEDNGHSPVKGSNSQGVLGPVSLWHNGASSKNVEVLEDSRPTKIRKRMIDLCRPADEYVDDSEEIVELNGHGGCGMSSQVPNGFTNTDSLSRRSNGLADLNEPLKAQETNEVSYGHLRDYGKALYSSSVREHVPVVSLYPNENGKSKVWPHQTPFIQSAKPLDSSSQPKHVMMNSTQRAIGIPGSVPPSWRERTFIDLEADTDTNSSHEVVHESSLPSHQPRHFYPYNPLDSAVPWNHLHSSWQNPSSFGFPQKVVSAAQRYPFVNLSDTLSGSAQKQGCFGDRFNSGLGNTNRSTHNALYNECSSSSKPKFSGTGYNYPNGGISDRPFMDSNGSGMKFVRDLNLNVTPSNTSVVEIRKDEERTATLPWLIKPKSACNSEVAYGKWYLKGNDAIPSSSLKSSRIQNESGNKVQNLTWLGSLKSGSCSNKPETEKINATTTTLKSSGFAYRDKSDAGSEKVRMLDINEPLLDECQQTEEQNGTELSVSNRCQFDLNMSVSEEDEGENLSLLPKSSRSNAKVPMIDLEAPAVPDSDDDDDDIAVTKPSEETVIEEKTLDKPPEFEKLAAETIVAISSARVDKELEVVASETGVILHWFAETVNTHGENLDQKLASLSRNQSRSIEEIDSFEAMTLQLPEITEDEYMPTPLVPDHLKLEEASGTTTLVATSQRPRRGNARKGKQRRDFQRDILPGIVPLTKHEVTEDIQMFDGFMRATGSSWTPRGLSRKKTGTRGRPRRVVTIPEPAVYCPVQAPSQRSNKKNGEVEMGIEEGGFGGWGKMTRRPRRQRCPSTYNASNLRCSSSSHAPFT